MLHDILIIGAGTAGLSASIYGVRAGHSVTVIEELPFEGGQIFNTGEIDNYPGLPGVTGYEFSERLASQAKALGARVVYEKVVSLSLEGNVKTVQTEQNVHQAKTVIIANGARHRKLGVEGEDLFAGRGVSYCATCDGAFYKGKDVCIVGGGNTALEDALFLSNNCQSVTLIHRRDAFRAHKVTVDAVCARDNIRFLLNSTVQKMNGSNTVESVTVQNVTNGKTKDIPVSGVFIAVGLEPHNGMFQGIVKLDEGGYIVAGEDCKTSCPGVFVAGDTRTKPLRQLVTAAADGAVAAVEASNYISMVFSEEG